MHRRARRLAAALQVAGLRARGRVAVLMANHAGHFECYFGVPAAGAVYHPAHGLKVTDRFHHELFAMR